MPKSVFPDPFEDTVTTRDTAQPRSFGYMVNPQDGSRWYLPVPPACQGHTFKMGDPAPWGEDGIVWAYRLGEDDVSPDGSFGYPLLVKNGVFLVWNVNLPGVEAKYEVLPRDLATGNLLAITSWSHANGDSVVTTHPIPQGDLFTLSTERAVSTETPVREDTTFRMILAFNVHK